MKKLKIIYKKFWISMLVSTNLMVSVLSNSSRRYKTSPFLVVNDKEFNPDNRVIAMHP